MPSLSSWRPVISASLLLILPIADAFAQSNSSVAVERPVRFDIAVQPLAQALDAYATATGLQVLYDSSLAAGRRSTVVRGLLVPDVALRILLEGTGLMAVYAQNSFAIMATPPSRNRSSAGVAGQLPYLALVQGDIERAFCSHPETVPGQYRLTLRFGIAPSGALLHPQMVGSSGDVRRDALIAEMLDDLIIEQGPPADMPQPVTMIVSPRPPENTGDCGPAESRPISRAVR